MKNADVLMRTPAVGILFAVAEAANRHVAGGRGLVPHERRVGRASNANGGCCPATGAAGRSRSRRGHNRGTACRRAGELRGSAGGVSPGSGPARRGDAIRGIACRAASPAADAKPTRCRSPLTGAYGVGAAFGVFGSEAIVVGDAAP